MLSIRDQYETARLAFDRISDWVKTWTDDPAVDQAILHRIEVSIKTARIFAADLESTILRYGSPSAKGTISRRAQIVWNEDTWKDHQKRMSYLMEGVRFLLDLLK